MLLFFKQTLLDVPHENGITIFVLGGLSVLSVYHFLLYFQHKDKSYLLYSLYTFILFLRNVSEPLNSFIYDFKALDPVLRFLDYYDINLEWMYNTIYFAFAFTFVNLKSHSLPWHRFIFRGVYILLLANLAVEITHRVFPDLNIYGIMFPVFIVVLLFFSIIGYVPLFRIKGYLKYYIIIGSLIFLVTSLIAFLISKLQLQPQGSNLNISIFFIGMALENIFFALGLGHKQKLILKEKNDSQQALINQLRENEKLKLKVQRELEANVASLSKQAEDEKIAKLKATFEKEIAELKVLSLRSQMNPHFIFNSLNAIKLYIINNEKENAVYYLNKFSKLIRKILSSTRERETSLREEIDTLALYTDIENIRFKNEIEVAIHVDASLDLDAIKVPALILQPFIENAIWHGLSPKKGLKKLSLDVQKYKGTHVRIAITDNGIGREKSAEINSKKLRNTNSIGLKLTEERLVNFAKAYKNTHFIEFIDLYDRFKKPNGTAVELKIPIK